ncbi:hypothetical protein ZHAS_00001448 [Anopheles sinensis]|uniref:Uncharacterized protein n=1 Tax=Anopheles sinensis TaxID=74873 RepID=A0A084VBB4_ANOSI|nr:hypothetical protein ZHAS_00001448 [Anopheles sinensis]
MLPADTANSWQRHDVEPTKRPPKTEKIEATTRHGHKEPQMTTANPANDCCGLFAELRA